MTQRLDPQQSAIAAEILRNGGTVVIPTETVYGLAADATNESAVQKIFQAKGRPSDNPLIAHLYSPEQLDRYCKNIPSLAYRLFEKFCPGPLTVVLPKNNAIVDSVTAGLETVAIRFPNHPTTRQILRLTDRPLAAPSANLSGSPSATTWQSALADLDQRVDAIVCDFPPQIGIESTVVDVTQSPPILLRPGAVTLEQLQAIEPSFTMLQRNKFDSLTNSPGLRYKHYQPKASVVIGKRLLGINAPVNDKTIDRSINQDSIKFAGSINAAFIGLTHPEAIADFSLVCVCNSVEEYAQKIFEFFRSCDSRGIKTIYCEPIPEVGLGLALMERIHRAAQQ